MKHTQDQHCAGIFGIDHDVVWPHDHLACAVDTALTVLNAPKTHPNFYQKALRAFLFYKFYKFMACNYMFFHKLRRLKCGFGPLKCGFGPLKCGFGRKSSDLQVCFV